MAFDRIELVLFLTGALSAIVVVLSYYLSINNKLRYRNDRIELDLIRENYEEKIHVLNQKLISENEKWKSVNHLLLNNEFKINNLKETSIPEYFINLGIPKNIKINEEQIFVLMPFLKSRQNLYNRLKNISSILGFKATRSDEKYIEKNIYHEIVRNIASAKIIIVDIDGRNPNVFYELGIAHSLNKPTILISKNKDKVPFDLIDKNIIFYQTFDDLEKKLKEAIPQLLVKIASKNSTVQTKEII
ncbi:MAG: hypothetical protein ACRDAG_03925, partial [Cetobacterium somerae]|uniref:hypothetical protein n=1 Tax=Cetobacterium somerae TaxID=188913 RepID=UPI003F3ECE34